MSKIGFFILAWLFLLLGVIGIFLPLLPTTVFVLLAAFFFSKSSVKFHQWLLSHRIFGPIVTDWENGGVIPLRAKIVATISIITMITISFYSITVNVYLMLAIVGILSLVIAYIWSRPTKK